MAACVPNVEDHVFARMPDVNLGARGLLLRVLLLDVHEDRHEQDMDGGTGAQKDLGEAIMHSIFLGARGTPVRVTDHAVWSQTSQSPAADANVSADADGADDAADAASASSAQKRPSQTQQQYMQQQMQMFRQMQLCRQMQAMQMMQRPPPQQPPEGTPPVEAAAPATGMAALLTAENVHAAVGVCRDFVPGLEHFVPGE